MENHHPTKNNHTPLSSNVLARIESEQLCPRSRTFFQVKEGCVWSLWLLSVAVGAIATAVMLFVYTSRRYAFYEATHDNLLTFILAVVPYLWLLIFFGMAGAALYHLRHTRRGYRYSIFVLLFGSVFSSLGLGGVLHLAGTGFAIDRALGLGMRDYPSQAKLERVFWQQPAAGRLVVHYVPVAGETRAVTLNDYNVMPPLTLQDIEGNWWQIDVSELMENEHTMIKSKQKVRLLGWPPEAGSRSFHACGAFPWLYDSSHSLDEYMAAETSHRARLNRFASSELALDSALAELSPRRCKDLQLMKKFRSPQL